VQPTQVTVDRSTLIFDRIFNVHGVISDNSDTWPSSVGSWKKKYIYLRGVGEYLKSAGMRSGNRALSVTFVTTVTPVNPRNSCEC